MSSSTYKGGLTPSGPEKTKATMRRPTPDSDAIASSDDEHGPQISRTGPSTQAATTGRRPSTGWLQDIQPNRKFSLPSVSFSGAGSNPTTPSVELPQPGSRPSTSSFLWNTNSFTNPQSGTRLKEVLPSPTSAHAGDRGFSGSAESDDGIGFLLNQQNTTRKSGRSQSYSIGQADVENSPLGQFSSRHRSSLRHRPSKPSLLGEGLSQLREDDNDEIESSNGSEQGVRLPSGYWDHNSNQGLLKQAAEQNARARYRAASTASPGVGQPQKNVPGSTHSAFHATSRSDSDYAVDEGDDNDDTLSSLNMTLTRRFSEFHGGMAHAGPSHAGQGESHGGTQWSLNDNLGRRHSFATYSTPSTNVFQPPNLSSYNEEDEDAVSPLQESGSPEPQEPFDASAYFTGYGPASRAINASAISAAHPAPIDTRAPATSTNPYAVPAVLPRAGRRLFVVTFKCSRADIYYTYDNTGLEIRAGDLVITEGDRGCDLGQVSHADVSLEDAKRFKAEALDEHFRWLVMFSQYSLAGAKEVGMLGALARANGFPNMTRATLTSMGGQQEQDTKPKMIKRLAQQHEIAALREKEGSEAKAKRMGAQKAVEHKLPMEILDAEFQADYHKLTFFYYAEAYVNFNPLVVDIFKQYKIRIWMSAVNPASVVNPAGLLQIQPPSAIGPGAIIHPRTSNAPAAVGPGFGTGSYRQNDQQRGRGNANVTQAQYEEPFYPFAHQLAGYPQQHYGVQSYGQFQPQQGYGRYPGFQVPPGGYPNASASASPMNYGGWIPPPATYSASPAFNHPTSGPAYRGGYPASTTGAPSAGASYGGYQAASTGQPGTHSSAPGYSMGPAYSGAPGFAEFGNGYAPASSGAYNDAGLAAAMANISFGSHTPNVNNNNGNQN